MPRVTWYRRPSPSCSWSTAFVCFLLAGSAEGKVAKPAWLEIYTAYATPTGGELLGRAHKGSVAARLDEWAQRHAAVEMWRTVDVEAIPFVRLAVTVSGKEQTVSTDRRGYFELDLPSGLTPPTAQVEVQLLDPRWTAEPVEAALPVFRNHEGLAVISDVDDTLLDTGVRDKVALVRRALTRPASELRAFDDAAATLTTVTSADGEDRPLVYISGSPTSFRQRLGAWLERSGFPAAPMILKRFSSEWRGDQMAYKWPRILALVDALPARGWILFGDSGESDPEIYRRLMTERSGHVRAVYIHLVTPEPIDAPRFRGMVPFHEWKEAAADLRARGVIGASK